MSLSVSEVFTGGGQASAAISFDSPKHTFSLQVSVPLSALGAAVINVEGTLDGVNWYKLGDNGASGTSINSTVVLSITGPAVISARLTCGTASPANATLIAVT